MFCESDRRYCHPNPRPLLLMTAPTLCTTQVRDIGKLVTTSTGEKKEEAPVVADNTKDEASTYEYAKAAAAETT